MRRRFVLCLLAFAPALCAQRHVDPKNTYNRVIAVVSFVGSGTHADPKRPQYAPWPPSQDPKGIIAFSYIPSDDGQHALVEFVARNRSAFQAIFNDKSITVFEKGVASKAAIESALQQFRKNFSLDTFGTVMP
jgi:hypothetical protein